MPSNLLFALNPYPPFLLRERSPGYTGAQNIRYDKILRNPPLSPPFIFHKTAKPLYNIRLIFLPPFFVFSFALLYHLMTEGSHIHTEGCSCLQRAAPLQQTVEEMEWDRGIWCAVVSGQIAKVETFLRTDAGRWLEARDGAGYTALHYASSNGREEIARLLLSRGCNASPTTPSGRTPLHKAASNDHAPVISTLLQHGGDPSLHDADGTYPIHDTPINSHSERLLTALPHYPSRSTPKIPKIRKEEDQNPNPKGEKKQEEREEEEKEKGKEEEEEKEKRSVQSNARVSHRGWGSSLFAA